MTHSFRITPVRGRVAILASGGLDSSVLLGELARRGGTIFPVYVRAGLQWEREELAILRRFIRALDRRNIAPITVLDYSLKELAPSHWSVTGKGVPGLRAAVSSNYLLGRNLSLLTKVAIFCAYNRIGRIAIATLAANPFPDARPRFFRAFERAAALGTGLPVRVVTPYAGKTKAAVIKKGRALPLQLTLSCARPRGGVHCGRCTKCAERTSAFAAAGVVDPARCARRPRL